VTLRTAGYAAAAIPIVLALGVVVTTSAAGMLDPAACATGIVAPPAAGDTTAAVDLSLAQRNNARIIYQVSVHMRIPHRGGIIAIATAMQESRLTNSPAATDHDSLGLFQQRPSQGWGTPAEILDPVHESTAFYAHLLRISQWQQLPVTAAAQAVQRSAYPGAYAKWEPLAIQLAFDAAQAIGLPANRTAACPPDCPTDAEPSAPSCEWQAPVHAPPVSGFRTPSRPSHDGVDLGAARFTPIHAAAAGTVIIVRCNIHPESYGCNRDGSPATPGCGWYVDISHADNIITRYCHMVTRPSVVVGQHVDAGQTIGYVGTSGHSSGPHLHFEVHLNDDRSPAGAIDPLPFMRQHGIDFTQYR
jgi:murein DD-endopeptidase MepM/ murein hydrolase activator NlpD